MVKTSKQSPTNTKCPVNLITGLLGSGKTTFIQHLLKTKPQNETWGLLINDFGEIGIDAATLQTSETNSQPIVEVSGGCLCCTAFHGYQQALSTLLSQNVDRILIEPTGLGHPAKIIDLLKQPPFNEQLFISGIISVATAQQLTPDRWQKSAIMRDIVTLADTLIVNKTDLASQAELEATKALLANIYPPKEKVTFCSLKSQTNAITPSLVDFKQTKQPFYLLAGLEEHAQQTAGTAQPFSSSLPLCTRSEMRIGNTSTIGWIFDSTLQFHRTRFLAWLDALVSNKSHQLLRAKGLIKTGNEWQQLNWVDDNAQLSDIAWRQDSRLELIFNAPLTPQDITRLETNLSKALFTRHQTS
ncbi:CobW family GTP-binding protein [Hydrogenovibrio kuenenii]|uniref:CobW family GTP-binding protein n=1 Tax=Hydrogenovibrio kuenenii TaxID=63658 RepID=UPI0004671A4B|nr:GTP-binding protein [Hydrogenovibrio kuenenii]